MLEVFRNRAFDILLRLGKSFGLDLPYFIKNHFYLSSATVVNIISGFVLSLLYARLLDKTTYGQYVLIFSFISTLSFTRITGLQSIFPYAIASGKEGFYFQAQKTTFITSLLGSLAFVGIALYYLTPGKPPLATALLLTAALFPFINGLLYYNQFLQAKGDFKTSSLYSTIQSIIPNFCIALAVVFFPQTFWLIAAALLPQAILNIYFTIKTLKKVKDKSPSPHDFKYGLKLTLVYLIPSFFQDIDDLILAKNLGFSNLAIYSFASSIPRQIAPFLKNFDSLAVPKLVGLSQEAIGRGVPKKMFQLSLVTASVAIAYIICAPTFFRIFYPQYMASVLPSQIYSLTLIFSPFSLVTQSFHRLRFFKQTVAFNWIAIIIKLTLFLILIPRFGVLGAAIAAVLLEAARFALALIMILRVKSQQTA